MLYPKQELGDHSAEDSLVTEFSKGMFEMDDPDVDQEREIDDLDYPMYKPLTPGIFCWRNAM